MNTTLLYFRKLYKTITQIGINEHYKTNSTSTLLFLNQLVYFSPTFITGVLKNLKIQNYYIFKNERDNALMLELDNFVILSFKGTEIANLQDWKTMFRFHKKQYNGLHTHAGFAEALLAIRSEIMVNTMLKSGKKIVYTGHSKGGALATLFATDVVPDEIITFGAPKIFGNIIAKERYNNIKCVRIVTEYDFVRYLPFTFPFHYQHICEPTVWPNMEQARYIFKSHQIHSYIRSHTKMESNNGQR